MAERISFGDTLILKGEKLLIDNGTSDGIIKSKNGAVKIEGDLTVTGNMTTVSSETLSVADNTILLNSNVVGTPTEDAGVEIERGISTNKLLSWDETSDKWTVGSESFVAGTFEGNLTGNLTGSVTGDITSTGTSIFSGIDINGGTIDGTPIGVTNPQVGTFTTLTATTINGPLTGTVTGTVSSISNHDTDDLAEGSTNLYYTDSRVDTHLNKINPTSGYVLSWNGADYAWVANANATTLGGLTDVSTTSPSSGQVLKWDGTQWAPAADATLGGGGLNADTLDGQDSPYFLDWTNTTNKPTIPTAVSQLTNDSGFITTDTNTTYTAGSGLTLSGTEFSLTSGHFDGAYSSLTGTPTIPGDVSDLTDTTNLLTGAVYTDASVDTHLNQSNPTSGYVLSWNGSDYSWVAQTGGSSYSDSDVATYLGGNLDTHILPDTNDTYDIGSATHKIRDLYVSDNSLHIGDNTLRTSGSNLLLNGEDVMDYANFKSKPTIPTAVSQLTNDSSFLTSVPAQSFASLTGKPTTLAGYGITDGGSGGGTTYNIVDSNTDDGILGNQTVGEHNVALGWDAGQNIALASGIGPTWDGHSNTALGSRALEHMTKGRLNVAIGRDALAKSQWGEENVAIGVQSMANAVGTTQGAGASRNTAIGHNALQGYSATNAANGFTGFDNVAIGFKALKQLESGYNNIAIGPVAGFGVQGDSKNNIFIGYKTGYSNQTYNNKLLIGMPDGNMSKILISGDFSAGTVTFNDAYTFPSADGTANQVLTTDGSGNITWTTASGGGTTYTAGTNVSISGSNAISVSATPTFDSVTTSNLTVTGTGNVVLASGNDLALTATDRVKITGVTPFKLAVMTTTERDSISLPEIGDMIYNRTLNKFQGYVLNAWVDLH